MMLLKPATAVPKECFVKGCITAIYEGRSNLVANGEPVCSRVCELEVISNTLKGYE